LRVSEVAALKVRDIDNQRMVMRDRTWEGRQGALRHALRGPARHPAQLLAAGAADAVPVSAGGLVTGGLIAITSFILALTIANSIKIANQWERLVVLRLASSARFAGPGLFFIIPIIETVAYRIDIHVITSTFKAEKTMTRDTMPVDVDAVTFLEGG
jgi:SPFH domain / Band 7 family